MKPKESDSTDKKQAPFQKSTDKYSILAVLVAIAFAALIFGPHLLDLSVPVSGDVRAHIFKIDFLYHHLSQGSWPGWNQYWYGGLPNEQYYPPCFYFFGAIITFITKQAVVSYKLLMLITMVSNGFIIFYFARQFLKIKYWLAILCLIAYESSTALLVNYIFGAIPNLFGWTLCVLFLASYLRTVLEHKFHNKANFIIPALLFGLTLLTHPFPAVFAVLGVVVFHIVYLAHGGYQKYLVISQLRFFLFTFISGALISSYYWVPFLLTRDYISPIHISLADNWGQGRQFVIMLGILALLVGLYVRRIIARDFKLDLLVVFVLLAAAMGFGLTRIMPFGLNSLLHEFRFATIVLPFFCILLVAYAINFLVNLENKKQFLVFFFSLSLIMVTSIIPFVLTYKTEQLGRLFSYVQNYRQKEYAEVLESVKDSRLVIPYNRGKLSEGDSPVTFASSYGVESVNGPYNQGDPKFFSYTVHLEWEERWFDYPHIRENLMQEGAARYLFVRRGKPLFKNMSEMTTAVNNSYGQLWVLNETVARSVGVTPLLLDVRDPERVTEFFNILLPQGYRMVFVKVDEVNDDLKNKFKYVMVDDESKISLYKDKNVYLLNNSQNDRVEIKQEQETTVKLSLPYLTYTQKFFYRGEKGDINAWAKFESDQSHRLTDVSMTLLRQAGDEMNKYIKDLKYQPLIYNEFENNIEVENWSGFILLKSSYFPYWQTENGPLMKSSQGFMLVFSDENNVLLHYKRPIINLVASVVTLASLVIIVTLLFSVSIIEKRNTRSIFRQYKH